MVAKRLLVFPGDPIHRYATKGEIKTRYWNPGCVFDQVDICTFADEEVDPGVVQELVGDAELTIHPLGNYMKAMATFPVHLARTLRLARALDPSVIRSHGAHIQSFYACFIGRRLNRPVIVSLHGDYEEVRSYRDVMPFWSYVKVAGASRLFERYALSRASSVICVTAFLERYARKFGAQRVDVIYNRVYTGNFRVRSTPREPGPLRILCVGRVNKQKNQECLLEAVRGLDVQLRLVGSDSTEYRDHLERLARQYGISQRVEFKYGVPHNVIHEEYLWADIFAIATKFEGFCIPILEAMACGLPVVASDIPPIAEILGDTGFLLEITPERFTETFQRLVDDTLRKKVGTRARARAEMLDGGRMEAKEKALYEEFMA